MVEIPTLSGISPKFSQTHQHSTRAHGVLDEMSIGNELGEPMRQCKVGANKEDLVRMSGDGNR